MSSSSLPGPGPKKRRVLIGVGGASNSGKTTLAKHIHRLLPNSTIIHLDDFAPPQDQIPFSPLYPDVQDWDTPSTALAWPLLRSTLAHFKSTGQLPEEHRSHDSLNVASSVGIAGAEEEARRLVGEVKQWEKEMGVKVEWGILDGFLLYWDPEVLAQIDLRIFLRVPYATLKARREERQVYVTQTQSHASAGEIWTDPPNYFDKIVYPAYVLAHSSMFLPPTSTPTSQHTPPASSTTSSPQTSTTSTQEREEFKRVEHGAVAPNWTKPRREGGEALVVMEPEVGEEGMGKAVLGVLEGLRGWCEGQRS